MLFSVNHGNNNCWCLHLNSFIWSLLGGRRGCQNHSANLYTQIMSGPKERHTYERDSSSDTEEYLETDDRRRRVFKNRMR